jgi:hypothetical protein
MVGLAGEGMGAEAGALTEGMDCDTRGGGGAAWGLGGSAGIEPVVRSARGMGSACGGLPRSRASEPDGEPEGRAVS